MDRELILHATLLLNAGNKTFDHIEAKCNPNIHFTSKILSFCLAIDSKIHSKTANWFKKETSHNEVSLPFSAQHYELASLAKQPVPAWLSTTNQEATWARFAR